MMSLNTNNGQFTPKYVNNEKRMMAWNETKVEKNKDHPHTKDERDRHNILILLTQYFQKPVCIQDYGKSQVSVNVKICGKHRFLKNFSVCTRKY